MVLRQPVPGKLLDLMIDASFPAAGYAVLMEEDPYRKYNPRRKTYAPKALKRKRTYSHLSGLLRI